LILIVCVQKLISLKIVTTQPFLGVLLKPRAAPWEFKIDINICVQKLISLKIVTTQPFPGVLLKPRAAPWELKGVTSLQ